MLEKPVFVECQSAGSNEETKQKGVSRKVPLEEGAA